jgi:hypothetical protein
LMNDDIYIMKPISFIPYFTKWKLKEHLTIVDNKFWHTQYYKVIEKVMNLFPNWRSYNTHTPITYNKTKLKKLLTIYKDNDISIRSLYWNHYKVKSTSFFKRYWIIDCKVYTNSINDIQDIEKQDYISTYDDLNYAFKKYFNKDFWEKCIYEI